MEKRGGKREGAGRPLTVGEPLSERIMVRLTPGEARALDEHLRDGGSRASFIRRALRAFLGLTVLLAMVGCDRPYLQGIGTACGDSAEICGALDLAICTSSYGPSDEAAFCTAACQSDSECGQGNICGKLPWVRQSPLICIPLDFCRTWNGGNCDAVGDVTIPPKTPGGIVSSGPTH